MADVSRVPLLKTELRQTIDGLHTVDGIMANLAEGNNVVDIALFCHQHNLPVVDIYNMANQLKELLEAIEKVDSFKSNRAMWERLVDNNKARKPMAEETWKWIGEFADKVDFEVLVESILAYDPEDFSRGSDMARNILDSNYTWPTIFIDQEKLKEFDYEKYLLNRVASHSPYRSFYNANTEEPKILFEVSQHIIKEYIDLMNDCWGTF